MKFNVARAFSPRYLLFIKFTLSYIFPVIGIKSFMGEMREWYY